MCGGLLVALLLGLTAAQPGAAQVPADCPADPAPLMGEQGGTLTLWLDLRGQPGVPRGTSGQVGIDIPVNPGGTRCEAAAPALPDDVLRGEPGSVLRGPTEGDPLRGTRPRVIVNPG